MKKYKIWIGIAVLLCLMVGMTMAQAPTWDVGVGSFMSTDSDWQCWADWQIRDPLTDEVLASQTLEQPCSAIVTESDIPEPLLPTGSCGEPMRPEWGQPFPEGALEYLRLRWQSENFTFYGLWMPEGCQVESDCQWHLVEEAGEVEYEDGVAVIVGLDPQAEWSVGCLDEIASCGTYRDEEGYWLVGPLQQEGEWYESCPEDPPPPTPHTPYPTQVPYPTQIPYTPAPIPTCRATATVALAAPTPTLLPTLTSYPTNTPYPPQP